MFQGTHRDSGHHRRRHHLEESAVLRETQGEARSTLSRFWQDPLDTLGTLGY